MKDETLNPAKQTDWFVDCLNPIIMAEILQYAKSKGIEAPSYSTESGYFLLIGMPNLGWLYSASVITSCSKEISIKDFFARCDAYAASSAPEPVKKEEPVFRIDEGDFKLEGYLNTHGRVVLNWGGSYLGLTKDQIKALHKFAKKHMK